MRLIASVLLLAGGCLLGCTGSALAHGAAGLEQDGLAWSFEPWVVISLTAAALGYVLGLLRMHRENVPHAFNIGRIAAFFGGLVTVFIALVSPIDSVAAELFSVHMVQHLLLMMIAAPLLVCGQPVIALLWAFPPGLRKAIGRAWVAAGLARAVAVLMNPLVVWATFNGLFTFWHIPAVFQWALRHEGVHTFEHVCFFVSSLAFWTIVIETVGRRRLGFGTTLVFVATTATLSALPGALMVFAPQPLYPANAAGVGFWGLTPIQDQQLGGLLMWIPAGLIYLGAFVWLFLRWLDESERHASLSMRQAASVLVLFLILPSLLGCSDQGQVQGAEIDSDRVEHGAALIQQNGCGICHTIPGIPGAHGLVGPPLDMMSRRIYIAGVLRNSRANMTAWLQDPQRFVPGNAMPDLGLSADDARDVTAYLYTLR